MTERNLPDIVKAWEQFKTLRHLQLEEMTEHRVLSDGFVRVAYANGERLYVNHTDRPCADGAVAVGPKAFRLVAK